MIKIHYKNGTMTEAHVEGTGAELVAEMACAVSSICKHLAEAEESRKDRATAYAYFMALTSRALVDLLDLDEDIKEVLKERDNKRH